MKSPVQAPLMELMQSANRVRKENGHVNLNVCALVNAKSGRCSEDCKFCAQSARYKTKAPTFPLISKDTIIKHATEAKKMGAGRFSIVTSGHKLKKGEFDLIANTIPEVAKLGLLPCASLGALSHAQLNELKSAGLVRYHHNLETSKRFYPSIVSTHPYEDRVNTVIAAKDVGLEVCSGGIFAIGETWQDRQDLALLLKELDVDGAPLNFLTPFPGTPLENLPPIKSVDAVRIVALFRHTLPKACVKIIAGRETQLKDFQAMLFAAGATGLMVGGYLIRKGRDPLEDVRLIREIGELWRTL